MVSLGKRKKGRIAPRRKRPVESEESDSGEEFPVEDVAEDVKESPQKMDIEEEEEEDSDRELQVAFETGLIKSDGLNYYVEKKRPIINRGLELREKAAEFAKQLEWIETLDVTSPSGVTEEIAKDDFEREVHFYKQAENAVKVAIPRLLKMGVKVFRPTDYYAQMAKPDNHMQKVRKRLLDVQEKKERQDLVKRMREEKKYATKVQKEVLAKRQGEKKQLAEAVKKHKKGMKGQLEAMLNNAKGIDMDDDDGETSRGRDAGRMKGGMSRTARDKKFGYGGRKKRSKMNTKESFDDVFGKKKFGKFGGPAKGGGGPRGSRKGRLGGGKRR